MVGSIHAASAFEFESIDGGVLNLEDFKGKPVLIVNTASRCGLPTNMRDYKNYMTNMLKKV